MPVCPSPKRKVAGCRGSWVGFTSLIVVDEAGMILAGHGKWLAAQRLNMTHVPTRVVGGLTEAQKNLYLIGGLLAAVKALFSAPPPVS